MLYLCFQLGDQEFAFDTDHVHSLAPVLPARPIPGTPDYVCGLVEYRSAIVPLIDLNHMLCGSPARKLLGTRMILVYYPLAADRRPLLGLVAEKALDTLAVESEALREPGIDAPDAGYLGKLFKNAAGRWVQTVEPSALLPDTLKQCLFKE